MPNLVPVTYNPFGQPGKPKLVPVDYNPFEAQTPKPLQSAPAPQVIQSPDLNPSDMEAYSTMGLEDTEALQDATKAGLRATSPLYRPLLEGTGAALGATAAAGAALPTGPGAIAAGVAGGAAGYAGGKAVADELDMYAGTKKRYDSPKESFAQAGNDLATGAAYEMGGQVAGPAIKEGAKLIGKVPGAKAVGRFITEAPKQILGKLSGVGSGAIDEAIKSGKNSPFGNPLKSSTDFDKALRGELTGEDVVSNARDALNVLKDQRAASYQKSLKAIEKNGKQVDTKQIAHELSSLMDKYNIKFDAAGKIDTSRIAMGKTGRNDIEEIIKTVSEWGSKPGDKTAAGLDVLKRQLDDFYSDSSQARGFVSSIRNSVKNAIARAVPEYGKMTEGYSEATKLIKDIESGLMMRKQGMSGRIVADQTLRRLMSAMKDNFTLRKELVDVLGKKGGQDVAGQVAGHTMRSVVPRGLAGTGPALAGQAAYAHFVNPQFWPVLAASSPRVQGEFLRLFGKAVGAAGKVPPRMVKEAVRQTAINTLRPPEAGTVDSGYTFKGGDPSDKNNWEKVQ